MKKTRSQKSRDTVPLKEYIKRGLLEFLLSSNLGLSPFPVSYSLYSLAGGGGGGPNFRTALYFYVLNFREKCLRPQNSRSVYTEAKKLMYIQF